MPNPITTLTFTPTVDCTIIATSTYSVQQVGTATDWGSSDPGAFMRLVKDSDLSTITNAPFQPCSRTRNAQTYRTSFSVLASNGAQRVQLRASGGGPGTSINFWDVTLTVEVIKR
jgi:hypothetical protein